MDWPEVIRALGYFLAAGVVAVIGAIGLWWFRLIPVRSKAKIDNKEVDAKLERQRQADARRVNKDAIEEWREVAAVLRDDCERQKVLAFENANKAQLLATEVAVQGFQIRQLTVRVEECETERKTMRALIDLQTRALARAGIAVEPLPASDTKVGE